MIDWIWFNILMQHLMHFRTRMTDQSNRPCIVQVWLPELNFNVLAHWSNHLQVDMLPHSHYSDFELTSRYSNSLNTACLAEKQLLPIFNSLVWLDSNLQPPTYEVGMLLLKQPRWFESNGKQLEKTCGLHTHHKWVHAHVTDNS